MGLDMYLDKKKFLRDEDRENIFITGIGGVNSKKVKYITEEVMYWRKANAIHQWFVDNVQDGDDNCKEYWVSEEKLEELLGIIEKILDNRELAEELLPTQGGFFFGGTEYDDYYFDKLKETKAKLKGVLDNWNDEWDYYYHSSW